MASKIYGSVCAQTVFNRIRELRMRCINARDVQSTNSRSITKIADNLKPVTFDRRNFIQQYYNIISLRLKSNYRNRILINRRVAARRDVPRGTNNFGAMNILLPTRITSKCR